MVRDGDEQRRKKCVSALVEQRASDVVRPTAQPKEVRIGEQITREWRYDNLAHTITATVPDAVKNWMVHLGLLSVRATRSVQRKKSKEIVPAK